jgi:hypothetical protein
MVAPNSTLKVAIKYEPKHSQSTFTSEIILNVEGGPSKKIICHASCPESSACFRSAYKDSLPKTLTSSSLTAAQQQAALSAAAATCDFGTIACGVTISKSVLLRNNGASKTVFRFLQLPPDVKVKPAQGKLDTGASLALTVTLYPAKPGLIKHSLALDIRGKNERNTTNHDTRQTRILLPSIQPFIKSTTHIVGLVLFSHTMTKQQQQDLLMPCSSMPKTTTWGW